MSASTASRLADKESASERLGPSRLVKVSVPKTVLSGEPGSQKCPWEGKCIRFVSLSDCPTDRGGLSWHGAALPHPVLAFGLEDCRWQACSMLCPWPQDAVPALRAISPGMSPSRRWFSCETLGRRTVPRRCRKRNDMRPYRKLSRR